MWPKICSSIFVIMILQSLLLINQAHALRVKPDFIYGVGFGYGNHTMDKEVTVEGDKYNLSRSETPGMLSISVETFITDRWSVGLSHRRGFQMGPFSIGVGFTGIIARRYFMNPTPVLASDKLQSSIIVQGWAPFAGFGFGIAEGSISREGEVVDTISTSGFFVGGHLGLDYQISPNLILRPELFYSTTLMNVSEVPSSLNEMGLILGLHFRI